MPFLKKKRRTLDSFNFIRHRSYVVNRFVPIEYFNEYLLIIYNVHVYTIYKTFKESVP